LLKAVSFSKGVPKSFPKSFFELAENPNSSKSSYLGFYSFSYSTFNESTFP